MPASQPNRSFTSSPTRIPVVNRTSMRTRFRMLLKPRGRRSCECWLQARSISNRRQQDTGYEEERSPFAKQGETSRAEKPRSLLYG